MDYKIIFDNGTLLFEYFGWYSLLLVLGTTLLMIPINLLYKKIMKAEGIQRLRKTISAITVFGVAMGIVALFTYFFTKQPLTFAYLISATLPCGSLSMLLWAVFKLVRDYGLKPVLKLISQSTEVKKALKDMGVNSKVLNTIYGSAKQLLKDTDCKTLEDVVKQEFALVKDIRTKLNGFVETANLETAVKKIVEDLKSKYSK